MTRCSKCGEVKELSGFNKDRSTPSGLAHWCRDCTKAKNCALYQANKEKRLAYAKAKYEANPEAVRQKNRDGYARNAQRRIAEAIEYQRKNPEKSQKWSRVSYRNRRESILARQRVYAEENPELFRAKAAARRETVKRATPPWVRLEEIGLFYTEARRLTVETGITHTVDHTIPLRHSLVCGLHVPWNLKIMTLSENASKSNKCEGLDVAA